MASFRSINSLLSTATFSSIWKIKLESIVVRNLDTFSTQVESAHSFLSISEHLTPTVYQSLCKAREVVDGLLNEGKAKSRETVKDVDMYP